MQEAVGQIIVTLGTIVIMVGVITVTLLWKW